MTERAVNLRRRLRQWFAPLRSTPLHPQWLAGLQGAARIGWVAERAFGAVLDVGSADGYMRSHLKSATSYVALDYFETASTLYRTKPDVYADASRLPFVEGCFDSILLMDVLEHLREPEAALSEAFRVLREGGVVCATIPFAYPMHDQPHDYQRFTEHGLVHRFVMAGFGKIYIQESTDAVQAAAGLFALALAQGAIDALATNSWRRFIAPLPLALIPLVNLSGWLLSKIAPARHLMPAAYHIHAVKQ